MNRLLLLLLPLALFVSCSGSKSTSSTMYLSDCSATVAGTYMATDNCAVQNELYYTATITALTPDDIRISNLYGAVVTATIDCRHSTINVPLQKSGDFTVSGSGTYNAGKIVINWTGYRLGLPMSCSTTYERSY